MKTITPREFQKRITASNYFTADLVGGSIVLYKTYGGRQIRITLKKNDKGLFSMQSSYDYTNRISHFTYAQSESRFNRNKVIIMSIVKYLKRSGVWQFVDKSFLVLNEKNTRLTSKRKRDLLEELMEMRRD